MIKAVMAQSKDRPWPELSAEEITNYESSINKGWEAHVFELPQPIASLTSEVKSVLTFQAGSGIVRVYPPFLINERKRATGAFEQVFLPEGQNEVEMYFSLSPTVTPGATAHPQIGPGVFFCQGLRIDVKGRPDTYRLLRQIIDHLCQYTHQWWLRAPFSPFRGPKRFGSAISRDFRLIDELKHRLINKLESSAYGCCQIQSLTGMEIPLSNHLWLLSMAQVIEGRRPESGLLAFHDAVSSYKGNEDERCVFHLCLTVEILGNKHRILKGQKPTKADRLIEQTPLLPKERKELLRKLFVDRGHVAHGRDLHHLRKDREIRIEDYLMVVRDFVSNYLNAVSGQPWPDIADMRISRI